MISLFEKGGEGMREEIMNGTPIPYDLPIEDLKAMMASSVMKEFSLACEALSYKKEPEAYRIMKAYINDEDKYRRLYILKTIFRHSEAVELVGFLENALMSDDFLFVRNGLTVISDYGIVVSAPLLISVVCKHLPKLPMAIRALHTIDAKEEYYADFVEIFKMSKLCVQREILGEILTEKYLPAKSEELFDLFSRDGFASIRLLALKIACKYGYDRSKFLSDIDGHVKKLAKKSLGRLAFLTHYISKYRVDVSDDLDSAIIYNPNGAEHLFIEYEGGDDFVRYTLSFSFQHVHVSDQESATEWIDGILNEKFLSIEYFCGEENRFGGQINASDLNDLSYEFLERDTGYYGEEKLFDLVDRFKVRGWTKKNDFDGHFVQTDAGIHIEIVSIT